MNVSVLLFRIRRYDQKVHEQTRKGRIGMRRIRYHEVLAIVDSWAVPARPDRALRTISSGLSESGPNACRTRFSTSSAFETNGRCRFPMASSDSMGAVCREVVRIVKKVEGDLRECGDNGKRSSRAVSGSGVIGALSGGCAATISWVVDAVDGIDVEGLACVLAARAAAIFCASFDNGFPGESDTGVVAAERGWDSVGVDARAASFRF